MKTTPAVLLFASASFLLSPLSAHALVTSTKAITCSATTKLQAAIDLVPAGTVATFNVTGTCNENIIIPQGKTIVIVGVTATSKITAANGALPAVTVNGDATVQKMILTNTTGAADSVIQAEKGGILRLIASDLSSTTTETIVGAYGGEVKVSNSRMVGGWGSGLDDWSDSFLLLEGNPAYPAGPTGAFESYVKSAGAAVSCGLGAILRVQTKTSGAKNGIVTIEQSQTGIGGSLCSFDIRNRTSNRSLLRIRNNQVGIGFNQSTGQIDNVLVINSTGNQGIYLAQGDMVLQRSSVTGNKIGLNAQQSQVRIDSSTFSNVNGDVVASNGTNMQFSDYAGTNSLPKALTWTSSFDCWEGSRIDIDDAALATLLGTKYDFLTCLYRN